MMIRLTLAMLATILGTLGTLAAIGVVIVVWTLQSQAARAVDQAGQRCGDALSAIDRRAEQAAARLQEIEKQSHLLEEAVKVWAQEQGAAELRERLQIDEKIDTALADLQQADQWIGVAESSLDIGQQLVEAGESWGIALPTDDQPPVASQVENLRGKLREASTALNDIKRHLTRLKQPLDQQERQALAEELLAKVAVSLGLVDRLMTEVQEQLARFQIIVEKTEAKVLGYLHLAVWSVTLLVLWLGLGQGALVYVGTTTLWQSKNAKPDGVSQEG